MALYGVAMQQETITEAEARIAEAIALHDAITLLGSEDALLSPPQEQIDTLWRLQQSQMTEAVRLLQKVQG